MQITNASEYKKALEVIGAGDGSECSVIFEDRLRLALQAVRYEQRCVARENVESMEKLAVCC
jgi:hypothetical protein